MSSTPKARRSSAETRAHVLACAHELFYWEGIHSTGIDKIALEAGVAPTTLYRLFASKDDLVAAYVTSTAEPYKVWMANATRPELGNPRERILALFDALAEQTQPDRCRGCPFLMTLAEYPDPNHPAHVQAVAIKSWVRDHLHQLTTELGAGTDIPHQDALADQLMIIIEGVYATVQALGANGPAKHAKRLATTLLDAAASGVSG